jgi:hypothetical protein
MAAACCQEATLRSTTPLTSLLAGMLAELEVKDVDTAIVIGALRQRYFEVVACAALT